MARDALKISVDVLDWAAREVGKSVSTVAETVAKRTTDRQRIIRGELTESQARKFADQTRIPFGFLFLSEPPELKRTSIPDLRQRPNPDPLSLDFQEVLEDVENKKEWFLGHLGARAEANRIDFVGRFKFPDRPKPNLVADDIRNVLRLTPADRRSVPTADRYFSLISQRAERNGILIMKSGIVKSNTRRALSPSEFQGFALADPIAPVIFVNGKDYEVASVFTLAHELAHIWLGESGVSDSPKARSRGLERFCNEIAAELLVPKTEFLSLWSNSDRVDSLANHFRVSRWVIAIRAFELDKITQQELDALLERRSFPRKKSSGGNSFANIMVRNSKMLTRELVASAIAGSTLIRHAASLLNIRTDTVMALARRRELRKV